MIKKISASEYPDIFVDVHVSSRYGKPVVGLDERNFILTEARLRPSSFEMPFAAYRSRSVDVALVASRSPTLESQRELMVRAARDIGERLEGLASLRVISAGPSPALVSQPGAAREAMAQAAADRVENYQPDWAFDLGVRLGVTELLSVRNKRALIFLSDGNLPDSSFGSYGLQETLDYMRNNCIVFYAVYTSVPQGQGELEFLARETGGKVYSYFNAEALAGLRADLESQTDGSYLLRYRSTRETDFGRAFIPVEVETLLVRRSGRDESGFFAPLEF
jgi:hypothetical protein